ncbi:MAG: aminotransferase class V-fold PLP-dependent enzyme [Ignavibacteriaceae bacterium]
MKIDEVRKLFPHLKTGKVYFNHASTGPMSERVKDKLSDLIKDRSGDKIDDFKEYLALSEETKEYLAELINCEPSRIAFVDNTSNGINILAQGLNLKKGDRILLNVIEFPANVYPFLNLKKNGIEIDFVKSHDGIVSADDIINSVRVNTKLISISFVQFLSGYKVDLEKIGNYCEENGIVFSVDAIQGLGAFQLDVKKYNVDFISCGTQKWLLGLQGLGFVFVSEDLQNNLDPKYVGWLSVKNAWNLLDYDLKLRNSAERFQNGTVNTFGVYALNASLKLFKEFGFENIEKRVIENSAYFLKELINIDYDPILKNIAEENLSGIISIKNEKSKEIFEELEKKNINAAFREGIVRFSPHFYNTKEEIDVVITKLKEISF